MSASECAACGKPAEGNASVHRDGFDVGPEVELCDDCGLGELPTLETIWAQIANRRVNGEPPKGAAQRKGGVS